MAGFVDECEIRDKMFTDLEVHSGGETEAPIQLSLGEKGGFCGRHMEAASCIVLTQALAISAALHSGRSSFPAGIISLQLNFLYVFFRAGLLEANSLSFPSPEKVFILPSY